MNIDQQILNTVISAVILPAVVAGTGYLVAFLKQKTAEVSAKAKNEEVKKYINLAEGVVEKAIMATSQTYVDSLKSQGTFDENAQKKAFDMAKNKAISLLNDEVRNIIKEIYGDVNAWLNTEIENKVGKVKADKAA
jgi:hypothetical protein